MDARQIRLPTDPPLMAADMPAGPVQSAPRAQAASFAPQAPAAGAITHEAVTAPPENGLAAAPLPATAPAPAATPDAPRGSTGLLGLHSDIQFGVLSPAREALDAADGAFQAQVKRIAASLQESARGLYPEAMQRIGAFDVYVAQSQDLSTRSSGTGKIAINAGFAALKPTDDWLAFVIAREMGHILSGHHDNNAGASIAVSVLMNLVVPGSGLIKSAVSFAGSQIASISGHDKQVKEADDAALKLLEGAGYTAKAVALNLRLSPLGEDVVKTGWVTDFRASAQRLTGVPKALVAETQGAAGTATPQPVAEAQAAPVPVAAAPLAVNAQPVRWQPEELTRVRPSGLPGPLFLDGMAVPARRYE